MTVYFRFNYRTTFSRGARREEAMDVFQSYRVARSASKVLVVNYSSRKLMRDGHRKSLADARCIGEQLEIGNLDLGQRWKSREE